MSIYETTIKNPKKIAEFYKQLSEQKDIEIEQLKQQLEECQLQNFNLREGIIIKKISFQNEEIKDKSLLELYNMPSYEDLKNENQELKKQLEVGEEQYNDLVELYEKELKRNIKLQNELERERKEYQETYKDVRSEIKDYKTQQKEFIEYLENEIKRLENTEFYIESMQKAAIATHKHNLSKYKEIIGLK